jgi:hypothetical protein
MVNTTVFHDAAVSKFELNGWLTIEATEEEIALKKFLLKEMKKLI